MASGRVRVYLDDGISSIKYASVDANGVRSPSSGYTTTSSNLTLSDMDHVYIYSCTLESGYDYPWEATYSGSFESSSTKPSSGTSSIINANIYPQDGLAATVRLSATAEEPEGIEATIELVGIEEVRLKYTGADGYGYTIYFTEDDNPLLIKPSSNIEILSITSFKTGYGSPVYAQGSGNPWDIDTDNLLEFGSSNKTFTLTATQETVYEFSWRIYTVIDGVTQSGYASDSYESSSSSTYSVTLPNYVNSSYYNDYDYSGYSFTKTGTKYSGNTASISAGSTQYIYVHFTTKVTYYPYELRVRIDGVRQSSYDESYDNNTSATIYFENILATSLYNNYKYIGYRTSSAGAIKTGDSYTLSSTSGTTLYIEFETPIRYYPYNIYVYVDGDYIDDFDKSSSTNTLASIDLSNVLASSLFSDYEFQYYTKNSSSTEYVSYSTVSLTVEEETDIYVYFQSVYYPYNIYVYVDGDHLDDFDESSATNTAGTINLNSVLDGTLFSTYTFQYYTKGSSSTQYTSYTGVSLQKNSTVSVYVYFITPTYTVTFQHYLDGSYVESSSTTKTSGSIINLSNYAQIFDGYTYDHAENTSGTTITSLTVTSNITVRLYYIVTTYTVTFLHYLGDDKYDDNTSTTVNYGDMIIVSDYAENFDGYLYSYAENSGGSIITSLTVYADTTVYLYYILNTVVITFQHCRGSKPYTITTETVNYGSIVDASDYKITSIPNCTYNSASSNSFKATENKTVDLYYLFAWTYAKTQGVEWNLTATEWNNLIAFVNDQRSSSYSFTSAVKGNTFTATMYNQMVSAIGKGTNVNSGDIITGILMNDIVSNANAM